jgi:hypothetical protein
VLYKILLRLNESIKIAKTTKKTTELSLNIQNLKCFLKVYYDNLVKF